MVWESREYGSDLGVFGRRFDAAGVPAGGEFEVDDGSSHGPHEPAVASASGDFVVVWFGWNADSYNDVVGRKFDAAGDSSQFRVSASTTGSGSFPAIASDAAGNFVVIWSGSDHSDDVFGRRFDAAGDPLGPDFRVNSYTGGIPAWPHVAASAAGDFVVVWGEFTQTDIFGQRFDSVGVPAGSEFRINTYTTGFQVTPDVASDAAGNFVVVWDSHYQDGSETGVFGQRFDSAGGRAGDEFQVNSFTTGDQVAPAVAMDGMGNFLVVWHSRDLAGFDLNVFGQLFDASGNRLGSEFQINSSMTGAQVRPAVTTLGDRSFVVVWQGPDGDGWGYSVGESGRSSTTASKGATPAPGARRWAGGAPSRELRNQR